MSYELFTQLILFAAGFWLLWIGVVMDTKNLASHLVFKFIPLSLSLCLLFMAVKSIGGLG